MLSNSFLSSLLIVAHISSVGTADGVSRDPDDYLKIPGTTKLFPYYTTHIPPPPPHTASWPDIEGVVIMQHGIGRSADKYFDATITASTFDEDKHAVIAPYIQKQADLNVGNDQLYWCKRWNEGRNSCDGAEISTMTVLDEVFKIIPDRFPNAKWVTIGGHSAGGQLVNRYAAAGKGPQELLDRGIEVRFMVMNPSSYLLLDPTIKYKYGLKKIEKKDYVKNIPLDDLKRQLTERKVYYLGGTADIGLKKLDVKPLAMAQGADRYERFMNYLATVTWSSNFLNWKDNSRFFKVPGVGHKTVGMIHSAPANAVLFTPHDQLDQALTDSQAEVRIRYPKVTSDDVTCEDDGQSIMSQDQCKDAARRMRRQFILTAEKPRPEGCYEEGGVVYFTYEIENEDVGAQVAEGRYPLCRLEEF